MSRMPRKESESGIYHVVARGTGKQLIFEDDEDRMRYLALLEKNIDEFAGCAMAWCLMGNHVHLLLQMSLDDLSACVGRTHAAYAMYFNKRHIREGHLFQDRFKSEPVDDDEYFLTVLRYIHQNPVKGGLSSSCSYRWSSYDEYLGRRRGFTDTKLGLGMLDGPELFAEFHKGSSKQDGSVLDIERSYKGYSDEQLLSTAKILLDGRQASSIKELPRDERDAAVRTLKAAGMTARQIQRLTGIALGSISAACNVE